MTDLVKSRKVKRMWKSVISKYTELLMNRHYAYSVENIKSVELMLLRKLEEKHYEVIIGYIGTDTMEGSNIPELKEPANIILKELYECRVSVNL